MKSTRWKNQQARLALVLPAALVLAAGTTLAQTEAGLSNGARVGGSEELRQPSTPSASSFVKGDAQTNVRGEDADADASVSMEGSASVGRSGNRHSDEESRKGNDRGERRTGGAERTSIGIDAGTATTVIGNAAGGLDSGPVEGTVDESAASPGDVAARVATGASGSADSALDSSSEVAAARSRATAETAGDASTDVTARSARLVSDVAGSAHEAAADSAASAMAETRAAAETAVHATTQPLDTEAVGTAVDGAVNGEVAGEIDASVRNDIRDAIEADLVTDITESLPLPGND